MASPVSRIRPLWDRLSPLPGGRWLFSRLLGLMVPYSGTVGARVEELAPKRCRVSLRERRKIRNHLGSIHAVALVNGAELASGLAMAMALPAGVRGIPTRIEVDFHRKARGRITVEGRADPPVGVPDGVESIARATLRNEAGETVAEARVVWTLGPDRP